MEEAHELCDRLGIFVDGQLVCIGSPQELTARYAGFYVRSWRLLLDGGGLGSWHCLRIRSNVRGPPQPTKYTLPLVSQVFTIMTPPDQGDAAHDVVLSMSPGARLTYSLAGTRKYEIPAKEVTLAGRKKGRLLAVLS